MITNFEEHTSDLSETELEMLPFLIQGFKKHDESDPIKAPVIVKLINQFFAKNKSPFKMTEVKLRKFVNHIRSNSLLPLIATSDGYFVTGNKEIIKSQIISLKQRAFSINTCAGGLETFLTDVKKDDGFCNCANQESIATYTFGDVVFCGNCNKGRRK